MNTFAFALCCALSVSLAGAAAPSPARARSTKPAQASAAAVPVAQPAPAPAASRDANVAAMLAKISPERIRARVERLAGFGTRHTLSDTTSETRGIGAARRWIKAELDRVAAARGGRLVVEYQSYTQEPRRRVSRPVEVVNVVATLRGSQPESAARMYVVSGHYDSIPSTNEDATTDAPGANDDASGTAAVMELAEVMSQYEFDATIVFMAVAGEEQGLLGSGYAASQARAANRDVAGMFTNDIVGNTESGEGRRDNRTVRVFSEGIPKFDAPIAARLRAVGGESDSPSRQLARFVDEAATLYLPEFDVKLVFRTDRYLRGGDHLPFLEAGYPAVRLTEPAENFRRQHQTVRVEDGVAYGDVVEKVDFDYVANVARVNAAALASLALAPPAPIDAFVDASKLENDTTLRWTAPTVPDLAGYEVVWRDTTAPLWERSLWVGSATEVTLRELSKDNLHFGVRAIDRAGHRSPVQFALPPPPAPPQSPPAQAPAPPK